MTDTAPAAPRKTGRPPKTDAATLRTAALTIGFPVTVGAVTEAVGVKYSTFYRHYPKVETLTAECVDVRLDEVAWPDSLDTGGWRNYLDQGAVALMALLKHYDGLPMALLAVHQAPTTGTPKRLVEFAEAAAERLQEAGLDAELAEISAWAVIDAATNPISTPSGRRHSVEFVLDGIDRIL